MAYIVPDSNEQEILARQKVRTYYVNDRMPEISLIVSST
jgi:hypothetical protein